MNFYTKMFMKKKRKNKNEKTQHDVMIRCDAMRCDYMQYAMWCLANEYLTTSVVCPFGSLAGWLTVWLTNCQSMDMSMRPLLLVVQAVNLCTKKKKLKKNWKIVPMIIISTTEYSAFSSVLTTRTWQLTTATQNYSKLLFDNPSMYWCCCCCCLLVDCTGADMIDILCWVGVL